MSGAFNTWFRSTISDLINLMKFDSVGVVTLFWQNFVMAVNNKISAKFWEGDA